ncbi:MAG: helix-hairpin-helix domain-containing protein [Bacilli bacterium]|nr:helix-hairpin-helix domain-containing protein [Bacilli bacterium]
MNLLLKYKHQLIIGGIVLLLVAAVSIPFMFASSNPILSQSDLDPCNPVEIESGDESSNYIVVDIKGAVKKPGVYKMPEGSIVQDVIDEAGGLKSTAYTQNINLSKTLSNEMVIIINTKSEMKNQTTKKIEDVKNDVEDNSNNNTNNNTNNGSNVCVCEPGSTTGTISNNTANKTLVNINTASKEELMSVSGIGASKADSIIIYRMENKFSTIDDIKNVSGIGDALFAKIKDYITV